MRIKPNMIKKKSLEYLHIEYRIFAYSIYIKHDAYFPGWEAGELIMY